MTRIQRVEELLHHAFQPTSLEVENFFHEHNVADGSESHLRVRIVSDAFLGARLSTSSSNDIQSADG